MSYFAHLDPSYFHQQKRIDPEVPIVNHQPSLTITISPSCLNHWLSPSLQIISDYIDADSYRYSSDKHPKALTITITMNQKGEPWSMGNSPSLDHHCHQRCDSPPGSPGQLGSRPSWRTKRDLPLRTHGQAQGLSGDQGLALSRLS